ncbi:DUF4123 domain-containing protein [Paraburkholderia hayleyella]|uniref:DUF4123 domain-containing protein n=1 Tax=Paraburkholderia hayleyella TaxID=2152889 RepID=UPI001580FBED|nr:DUF4123 domain-containing protein [Paraburkholderia hayleyella]
MIPASVAAQLREFRKRHHYSSHVVALVDGLQYQQHTGWQLTPEDGMAVSLFAGTKEIALAHAGPWLIDPKTARERVGDLGKLEQGRPGVIWLITSESLERQAAKLRPHLNTRLPTGQSALLRFWDPRVLHALNAAYQDKASRSLFRTAEAWQYLNEGQRFTINDNATH